jgi:isopenicillin-N N-acyltransferase-like protein
MNSDDMAVTVLELSGDPYQRGLTHGRLLQDQIESLVQLLAADVRHRYDVSYAEFAERFVGSTGFVDAARKSTPELLDEIQGIAVGSGQSHEVALTLNFMDEYWVHALPGFEACSSFGGRSVGGSTPFVAQNMDLPILYDGYQVVLRIEQPEGSAAVLSYAGCVGLNGVNSAGVGICCNTLMQLRGSRGGLPVAFVVRGALARGTARDARRFIESVEHASGQNYVLGDPAYLCCLECSAGKVVEWTPPGESAFVWHTNHPLVNDDVNTAEVGENTVARLSSLESRLGGAAGSDSQDLALSTLRAHDSHEFPVCVPRGRGAAFTFAGTLMELAPEPALHVSNGPPDTNPLQRVAVTAGSAIGVVG